LEDQIEKEKNIANNFKSEMDKLEKQIEIEKKARLEEKEEIIKKKEKQDKLNSKNVLFSEKIEARCVKCQVQTYHKDCGPNAIIYWLSKRKNDDRMICYSCETVQKPELWTCLGCFGRLFKPNI